MPGLTSVPNGISSSRGEGLELLGCKHSWVVIPENREQPEQPKSSPCYVKLNISTGAVRGEQSGVRTSRCS